MSGKARLLVAGLGNLFRGDDAFGSEVTRRLQTETLPGDVRAVDFGTRGYDFAFALADGYESVVVIDTVDRGAEPGTLMVIHPNADELQGIEQDQTQMPSHDVNPLAAISWARRFTATLPRIIIVGCQPLEIGDDLAGHVGLSDPVAAAIEPAMECVKSLLAEMSTGPAVEQASEVTS